MAFNKLILTGNLTRDPELRVTPQGMSVLSCSIASNRRYGDKEEVTFVEFTAFKHTAENINKFFSKGSPILLEGRLKTDTWDDKATGAKRSKLTMVVESFDFFGGKNEAAAKSSAPPPQRPAPPPANESEECDDYEAPPF